MHKITLHESHAPYTVTLDETTLRSAVTVMERDGQPVAVLLSADEYESFRAWQQLQRTHVSRTQAAAFAQERAAFQEMLPQLAQEYHGKVVAIFQGSVVGVGDEIGETLERVYTAYGYVPCYVGRVEVNQRIYKMPHRKVAR
jgi:PHD/YefM family antitoxin component YafN of YafNO toxin-antitoxin module